VVRSEAIFATILVKTALNTQFMKLWDGLRRRAVVRVIYPVPWVARGKSRADRAANPAPVEL
jgi:hypothetical protein